MSNKINTFDCDGVVSLGIYPGPNDVIITGRSFEETPETMAMLEKKGINVPVFFNPAEFDQKSREGSGQHKAKILNWLKSEGYEVGFHFEDDEIQIEEIKRNAPWMKDKIIHIVQNVVPKHNVRHTVDEDL